jgi:UDP-galactopyranose mutase
MENYDFIIIGCGLSGAVIAERLASILNKKVCIIEKRNHIGGNCYDYIDSDTNILVNQYGPHFFHTNNQIVFEYIHKFSEWVRYEHKVLGCLNNIFFPIPINITTVNLLCNQHLQNETEMNHWLSLHQIKYELIKNSEQMGHSRVGKKLYELIFKNYTQKQWNRDPKDLNPEILARIPIHIDFDTRYFSDKYQLLPKYGYTKFFENLLNHPNITVILNTDFFNIRDSIPNNKTIIYTGPIDHYYSKLGYEQLEYRSINFVWEKYFNMNYYQPGAVVNYPDLSVEYTRITEYKHCLNQNSPHTIICKEFPTEYGDPYYPILNQKNLNLYQKYKKLSQNETNIHFLGRLANYKYFNMDEAIFNSLDYFQKYFIHLAK